MAQTTVERLRELTSLLNQYRDEYYNKNAPTVSDEIYDRLFDELVSLEEETGIFMANSPSQTVGYPAVSSLEKTEHKIPLLSLDKTKSVGELHRFMGGQQILLMLKLDGLTMKLTYEGGNLVEASTRGDGNVGEIVTHNVCGITGIPMQIPYRERLVVTGEALIRPSDFETLRATLTDSNGSPYKNGRNLAAGSVRLLAAEICKDRKVTFMPFHGSGRISRNGEKIEKAEESVCTWFSGLQIFCNQSGQGAYSERIGGRNRTTAKVCSRQ